MTDAVRTEEIAARWLLRQSESDWSHAEQRELDAWLDASAEHKVAYWRLEMGWDAVGRMAALRTTAAAGPLPPERSPARRWWPAAIAATLVAALVPALLWTSRPVAKPTLYATPLGGHGAVALADGSRVELNTSTRVRTTIAGGTREVWLDAGEAYFEVAHDASRPFVVHAGPKLITVLGTKFSVRRDGDRVEVAVVEGRVRVENAARSGVGAGPAALLTRGDMVIAQGGSTMEAPRSIDAVSDELAWRGGMLDFDQTTLADAVGEFNRYNRKQLVVTGNAGSMRIGGSFDARNIEIFARLLQRTYGLKIDDRGDTIKISE